MAGQGKARGAALWLRGHLFLGMELPVDAKNKQPQGTKEEKPDFGSLLGTMLSFGEKTWVGFYQERRGQKLSAAWRICFRTMCWAALNLSFVTGLGQCDGSAPPPQTHSSSVLPSLPRPAELAGGKGNKTLAGCQDIPPFCRAAAAMW